MSEPTTGWPAGMLKPCPFCGGAARSGIYSGAPIVNCVECPSAMGGEESTLSHAELAEAWNRRAPCKEGSKEAAVRALIGLLHRHKDGSDERHWAEWDDAVEAVAALAGAGEGGKG